MYHNQQRMNDCVCGQKLPVQAALSSDSGSQGLLCSTPGSRGSKLHC